MDLAIPNGIALAQAMVSGLTGNAAVYPAPPVAVLKEKGDILLSSILRRVCWILASDSLQPVRNPRPVRSPCRRAAEAPGKLTSNGVYLNSPSRIEIPVLCIPLPIVKTKNWDF